MKKQLFIVFLTWLATLAQKVQASEHHFVCEGIEVVSQKELPILFAITYKDFNPETNSYDYEELDIPDSRAQKSLYSLRQLRTLSRYNRCVRLVELQKSKKHSFLVFEYQNSCQKNNTYSLSGHCQPQP